jgi:hypothetical protein
MVAIACSGMPVKRYSYARSGLPIDALSAARVSASGNPIAVNDSTASGVTKGDAVAAIGAAATTGAFADGAAASTGAGAATGSAAILGCCYNVFLVTSKRFMAVIVNILTICKKGNL